jgi:hypothetical protein
MIIRTIRVIRLNSLFKKRWDKTTIHQDIKTMMMNTTSKQQCASAAGIAANTGPDGPTGWHKACPYTGGVACPYTGGLANPRTLAVCPSAALLRMGACAQDVVRVLSLPNKLYMLFMLSLYIIIQVPQAMKTMRSQPRRGVTMAGYHCLMPTASAVQNLRNLNIIGANPQTSRSKPADFSEQTRGLLGANPPTSRSKPADFSEQTRGLALAQLMFNAQCSMFNEKNVQ